MPDIDFKLLDRIGLSIVAISKTLHLTKFSLTRGQSKVTKVTKNHKGHNVVAVVILCGCRRQLVTLPFYLSPSRNINFNPDQVSSTAQTFTSTSPFFNPKSRIMFSSRSVAIPDDFFGHDIHIMPSFFRIFLLALNFAEKSLNW